MKAVLFDLDGTLLNTLPDLHQSVNFALASHGLPLKEEADIRRFLGNGVRRLIDLSLPENEKDKCDAVLETFLSHYHLHAQDKTAPYPGISDLIRFLKEKNVAVGIVSNKIHSAVQGLNARYFPEIPVALGEQEGIPKKPAPDSLFLAMEKLCTTPEECLYIGDSEVDILTGKNASIPCICVSWGFRDKKDLIRSGAESVVDTVEELIALLQKILNL